MGWDGSGIGMGMRMGGAWDGMGWDGMGVIIGHRSSKSPFAANNMSLSLAGTRMLCVGYRYRGNDHYNGAPGLIIHFGPLKRNRAPPQRQAHFHLEKSASTKPRSVNYPYEKGRQTINVFQFYFSKN